jgi:hypothetical protein
LVSISGFSLLRQILARVFTPFCAVSPSTPL